MKMVNYIKLPSRFNKLYSYIFSTKPRLSHFLKPPLSSTTTNCYSQIRLYGGLDARNCLTRNDFIVLSNVRYKSKGKRKNRARDVDEDEDESDSDEDDDDAKFQGKDTELKTYKTQSLRVDTLLKIVLGAKRKRIEEAFYENKLRLNGSKLLKKGATAKVGDEIDLIKGVSEVNPDFLIVGRVEILSCESDEDGILVKAKKSKSLLIENYDGENKWVDSQSSSQN